MLSGACFGQKCHIPLFPLCFWDGLAPGLSRSREVRVQAHFWGFHQDFGPFSRAVSMATPGESKLTNLSPNRCCRAPLHQEEEFGLQEPCKENPEGNAWGILVTKCCWKPKGGTDPTEQQGRWGL